MWSDILDRWTYEAALKTCAKQKGKQKGGCCSVIFCASCVTGTSYLDSSHYSTKSCAQVHAEDAAHGTLTACAKKFSPDIRYEDMYP